MPIKQGDLDSLCGIYAIVNAMQLLCPLTTKDRRKLFKKLVRVLEKQELATHALLHGTWRRHMNRMLKAAIKHMQKRHGIRVTVEKPFTINKRIIISSFWQKLQNHLMEEQTAAIISLNGKISHWVCVKSITASTMHLEDSGGKAYVRKQQCRISRAQTEQHYYLVPKDCWLLSICST